MQYYYGITTTYDDNGDEMFDKNEAIEGMLELMFHLDGQDNSYNLITLKITTLTATDC